MGPFETIKTIEFSYQDHPVRWQLQIGDCFSFVRCGHPMFISRFGHANIITQSFCSLFDDILESDEDYEFFYTLQLSMKNYPLGKAS